MPQKLISRLLTYMSCNKLSVRSMAILCGIDPSNFQKMIKCEQPISEKTIKKILDATHINKTWLLTGEGEMRVATPSEHRSTTPILKEEKYRLVNLINIDSVGGIHSDNAITPSEQYIISQIPFTEAREGDVAILQSGNSMYPTIPPGSALLIRQVSDWQEYFGYGGIFVLWLKDGRRITKEVRRYDPDPKNYVWCVSYNPDVADEELPKSMIRGVWKVVKYIADFGW